jgi:ParB-like chromosome segregation protein Spo0J
VEKRIHNLTYTLAMIRLAACVIDGNIRVAVDDDEIRRLGDSLKKRQIHPIIVLDNSDGTFRVLDGGKRVRAAGGVGMTELLAAISTEPMTPEQIIELQLVTAFHRSDPSGFDQWQAMEAVKAAHPGWTQKQLADLLNIDAKMVKVLLSPGLVIERARDAFREGKIGISDCHTLSLHEDPAEQGTLLANRLGGMSRDAVAVESRKRRNGNGTVPAAEGSGEAAKVVNLKILLPGGKSVVVKGENTLPEVLELLKKASKEVEAAKGKLDAKGFQEKMRHLSKAADVAPTPATEAAAAAV